MSRCIELAKNGLGTTYPNPLVGSVLVYNNLIIGEGWHYKAGKAHAEVHAITNSKKPPDIIYHKGDMGKEPMIIVFAQTPDSVMKKILKII